jgi:predicted nucleic acid-binding protein
MASVVVDSSVVIKWFLPEPYAAQARAIRAVAQTGALILLAPTLIYAELGNIVWKKQTLQRLAAPDARRIIDAVRAGAGTPRRIGCERRGSSPSGWAFI